MSSDLNTKATLQCTLLLFICLNMSRWLPQYCIYSLVFVLFAMYCSYKVNQFEKMTHVQYYIILSILLTPQQSYTVSQKVSHPNHGYITVSIIVDRFAKFFRCCKAEPVERPSVPPVGGASRMLRGLIILMLRKTNFLVFHCFQNICEDIRA